MARMLTSVDVSAIQKTYIDTMRDQDNYLFTFCLRFLFIFTCFQLKLSRVAPLNTQLTHRTSICTWITCGISFPLLLVKLLRASLLLQCCCHTHKYDEKCPVRCEGKYSWINKVAPEQTLVQTTEQNNSLTRIHPLLFHSHSLSLCYSTKWIATECTPSIWALRTPLMLTVCCF